MSTEIFSFLILIKFVILGLYLGVLVAVETKLTPLHKYRK